MPKHQILAPCAHYLMVEHERGQQFVRCRQCAAPYLVKAMPVQVVNYEISTVQEQLSLLNRREKDVTDKDI